MIKCNSLKDGQSGFDSIRSKKFSVSYHVQTDLVAYTAFFPMGTETSSSRDKYVCREADRSPS